MVSTECVRTSSFFSRSEVVYIVMVYVERVRAYVGRLADIDSSVVWWSLTRCRRKFKGSPTTVLRKASDPLCEVSRGVFYRVLSVSAPDAPHFNFLISISIANTDFEWRH